MLMTVSLIIDLLTKTVIILYLQPGFVKFYENGDKRKESPWPSFSKMAGLIGAGAIGAITLGALLVNKS